MIWLRLWHRTRRNNPDVGRMLFRNYLRQHDDRALAYSTLKRNLAEQFPYDGDRYTSEKRAFISEIVCAAQKDME